MHLKSLLFLPFLSLATAQKQIKTENSTRPSLTRKPPPAKAITSCIGINLPANNLLSIGWLSGPASCPKIVKAEVGDTLSVRYVALRYDSCEVQSMTSSDELFTFKLGAGEVVEGWDVGLVNSCMGQTRKLTVASDMAYGAGVPAVYDSYGVVEDAIESGATLIYTIDIVGVTKGPPAPKKHTNTHSIVDMEKPSGSTKFRKQRAPINSAEAEAFRKNTYHPKAREGERKDEAKKKDRRVRKMRRLQEIENEKAGAIGGIVGAE